MSPRSNLTYPLSWRLDFNTRYYLNIKSARADQEIYGPRELGDTVYAGYATVSGRFLGRTTGWIVGLVTWICSYSMAASQSSKHPSAQNTKINAVKEKD